MPIIPSGGGYPGIIGEAELIAAAVASVAADKAAASADAATVAALVAPAQQDAASVAAAKSAAVQDAADVAAAKSAAVQDAAAVDAAKAAAVPDAADVAAAKAAAVPDAADVAAAKAQAEADAGTIAGLVPGATADAEAVASAKADALSGALDADAARLAAQASAATAAAAVADVTVAPLDAIATSAQVVRGSDLRLGLRGGVALTVGGASATTAIQPVAPFSLNSLGLVLSAGFGASSAQSRFLFSTGTGTTTADILVRLVGGAANTLRIEEGNGAGGYTQTTKTFPSGASSIWFVHDAAAATLTCYADSSDTPAFTHARVNSGALNAVSYIGGTIRSVVALNFSAAVADRIAAMRGEYPQAWLGGSPAASAWTGAWTDQNWTSGGGGVTANSAGALVASCPAATALYALKAESLIPAGVPVLAPGRKLRIRYDLTLNSGVAPTLRFQQGNIDTTVTLQLVAGAGVVQEFTVGVVMAAAGINVLLQAAGASSFSLSNVSLEILGAQVLVGPQDWTRTRGVDMSGNCNDLAYGTGVVAVEPATKARVIQATAAGATVSAGAVSSVGALTGATYRDAKALAALRRWDSVSANWRQTRPANCAALQAAVPANGAPLVEATAITGNAVVSANAALNLTHTID